jgi:predicted transcriptional regulator
LNLEEIANLIECDVVVGVRNFKHDFEQVCAADLMSDVLAYATPGSLLLTGLRNAQSVVTAHMAEVKAVIYVRGKMPDDPAQKLGEQRCIPLLTTKLSMFEACGRLFDNGLRSGLDTGQR